MLAQLEDELLQVRHLARMELMLRLGDAQQLHAHLTPGGSRPL